MLKAKASIVIAALCLGLPGQTDDDAALRAGAGRSHVTLIPAAMPSGLCHSRSERYELAAFPPFLFSPRCF